MVRFCRRVEEDGDLGGEEREGRQSWRIWRTGMV